MSLTFAWQEIQLFFQIIALPFTLFCTAGPAKSLSQYPPKLVYKDAWDCTLKKALIVPCGTKSITQATVSPSFTDKTHFPFITLYHKRTSTGKRGLELVKLVPGFRLLGSVYLMIYIPFGK